MKHKIYRDEHTLVWKRQCYLIEAPTREEALTQLKDSQGNDFEADLIETWFDGEAVLEVEEPENGTFEGYENFTQRRLIPDWEIITQLVTKDIEDEKIN